MPTIEVGLKAYIEAQVASAGNGYPREVPVDADFPAWSYFCVSDDELLAHDGPTGFASARIQCDFIAKDTGSASAYAVTKTIATAVRNALDGFQGSMGGVTVDYCKTELTDDWAEIHQLPVQRFDVILRYHR